MNNNKINPDEIAISDINSNATINPDDVVIGEPEQIEPAIQNQTTTALRHDMIKQAFFQDPLAFCSTPDQRRQFEDIAAKFPDPEEAKKKLALAAYYSMFNNDQMPYCFDNLEAFIGFHNGGKPQTVDQAFNAIAKTFNQQTPTPDQQQSQQPTRQTAENTYPVVRNIMNFGKGVDILEIGKTMPMKNETTPAKEAATAKRYTAAFLSGGYQVIHSTLNAASFLGKILTKTQMMQNAAKGFETGNMDYALYSAENAEKYSKLVENIPQEHWRNRYQEFDRWTRESMQLPDNWMTDSASFGDWFANAGLSVVNYVPQLGGQIMLASAGGLPALGTVFGINAYYDIKDEKPEIAEEKALFYGAIIGAINTLGEKVTFGIIKGEGARKTVKAGVTQAIRHFGGAAFKEGAEEAMEQIAENVTDILFGRRGDDWQNWDTRHWYQEITAGVHEAFFLGAATGAPLAVDSYRTMRARENFREAAIQNIDRRIAEINNLNGPPTAAEFAELKTLQMVRDAGNYNDIVDVGNKLQIRSLLDQAQNNRLQSDQETKNTAEQEQLRADMPHNPQDTRIAAEQEARRYNTPVEFVEFWTPEQTRTLAEREIARLEHLTGAPLDEQTKQSIAAGIAASQEAIWMDGKVIVNINTTRPHRIPFVLMHEIVGHEGIRAAFGESGVEAFYKMIWTDFSDTPLMNDIVSRYNLRTLQTDTDGNAVLDVDGNPIYDEMTEEQKSEAADEFLAHLAETNGVPISDIYTEHQTEIDSWANAKALPPETGIDEKTYRWMNDTGYRPATPNWFKRMLAKIRLWLKQHGWNIHLSDNDIRSILACAARTEKTNEIMNNSRFSNRQTAGRIITYMPIEKAENTLYKGENPDELLKIFLSFPEYTTSADGRNILIKNPETKKDQIGRRKNESKEQKLKNRFDHLTRSGTEHNLRLNPQKTAWLPRIVETIKNAQAILTDPSNGNDLYIRRYAEGYHAVIVAGKENKNGTNLINHGLITHFPESFGGQRRDYKARWIRKSKEVKSTGKSKITRMPGRTTGEPIAESSDQYGVSFPEERQALETTWDPQSRTQTDERFQATYSALNTNILQQNENVKQVSEENDKKVEKNTFRASIQQFDPSQINSERRENLVKLMAKLHLDDKLDDNWYVKEFKDKFHIDIAPEEVRGLICEARLFLRTEANRRSWREAYDYYAEAHPLFHFLQSFIGYDFKVRPGTRFYGLDFSGSFISEAVKKYSRKRRQARNESNQQYERYLAKREAALANADGMKSDIVAQAYADEIGGDATEIEQQLIDMLQDLKRTDIRREYKEYKEEYLEMSEEEKKEAIEAMKADRQREIEENVADVIAEGKPIDDYWIINNRAEYKELYRHFFKKDAPNNPGKADLAAINAALVQEDGDPAVYAAAYKQAKADADKAALERINEFRQRIRDGREEAIKLQKEANAFLRQNLPPELRGKFDSRIIHLMELETPEKRAAAFDKLCKEIIAAKREYQTGALKEKLKSRLDQLARRADAGRKAIGVRDESTQQAIDLIREFAEMDYIQAANKLEEIQSQIEIALDNGQPTADLEIQLRLIEEYGDIFNADATKLENAWLNLQKLARDGKMKIYKDIFSRASDDEGMRNLVSDVVTGKHGPLSEYQSFDAKRVRQARSELRKIMDENYWHSLNLWGVLDALNLSSNPGTFNEDAFNDIKIATHQAQLNYDVKNGKDTSGFRRRFDRLFKVKGTMDRAEKIQQLRETISKTGVFRRYPTGAEKKFTYERLTVPEAQKLLRDYDDAIKTGQKARINDYEAEAIRHQLRLKDARIKLEHQEFADGITDKLLQLAREEEKAAGETNDAAKKEPTIVIPRPVFKAEVHEMHLSQMEGLYLWLCWEQKDVRYKMRFNGYDENTMTQLEKFLKPETKELGKWMRYQLEIDRSGIDKAYRELYFTAFPHEDNYFPTFYGARSNRITGNEQDMSKPGEGAKPMAYTPGSLKLRVFHLTEPEICDALTLFQNHRLQMNHFVTHAKANRELRAIFANPLVKKNIIDFHGESAYNALASQLRDFINGGNINVERNALYQRIYSAAVRAKMTFNITSGIKQTLGFLTYIQEIPTVDFARNWLYAISHPKEVYNTLWQTDYVQNRWNSGGNRELKMLLDPTGRNAGKTAAFLETWDNISSLPLRAGDICATLFGGYAIYKYHRDRLMEQGIKPEIAHSQALLEMEMATERTQQSSATHMLTPAQKGAWRIFTTFKSNQILLYNKIAPALRNGNAKAAGKGLTALILSSIAMTAFGEMLKHGTNFDDYEWWNFFKEIFADGVSGAGVPGSIANSAIENAFSYSRGSLLERDLGSAIRSGYKMPTHIEDEDWDKVWKDTINLLTVTGFFYEPVSIPASLAREMTKIFRVANPDDKKKKRRRRMLGPLQ